MPLRALLFFTLLAIRGLAADIEIVGEYTIGTTRTLSFVSPASPQAEWVKLGGNYRGYHVASYDPATKTARLEKAGETLEVRWRNQPADGAAAPTALTPEQREEIKRKVLHNLRQLGAAADQFYLEHGTNTTTLDKLIGNQAYIKQLNPIDGEDYTRIEFQQGHPLTVTTAHGDTVTYAP